MSIFEFDEEKEWKLIREDEYQYGLEEGRKETVKESLNIFVDSLKMLSMDLETVYKAVIQHEMYKDVTLEQVRELYYVK